MRIGRRSPEEPEVARGERLLAAALRTDTGARVGGTRDALYLPERLPWERIATAEWHQEDEVLRVVAFADFGQPQPVHLLPLSDSDRLLQLVRERITATFVLQRHVPVRGQHGVRLLARRPPGGGEISWFVEYDAALDPDEPGVRDIVADALAAARSDVGC